MNPWSFRVPWEAGAMIYPTGFPEISCINAMKAQANGCFPVSSRFAALRETSKHLPLTTTPQSLKVATISLSENK